MIKKLIVTFTLLTTMASSICFAVESNAQTQAETIPSMVDFYRSKQITLDTIQKKIGKNLGKLSRAMSAPGGLSDASNRSIYDRHLKLVNKKINKLGNFSYIHISNVIYENTNKIYFTIDLVDTADKDRLAHFLPTPTGNIPDPDNLIKQWGEYETISLTIFNKEKRFPTFKHCPAFHCSYGFEDPALQKFGPIFSTLVPKDKIELISMLKNDKDPIKRKNAAYLLAHIKNSDELIKTLTPSIYDVDSDVRNAAMRVIALTLFKVKVTTFPIEKLTLALDFPDTTDRNKALAIVDALSTQHLYGQYIINNMGDNILSELKLQQLNVHGLAYDILKNISGKTYNDHDYAAWEKWLASAKKQPVKA